jgi:hypothetical protein
MDRPNPQQVGPKIPRSVREKVAIFNLPVLSIVCNIFNHLFINSDVSAKALIHGLINYIDTKAKRQHLANLTC